MYGYASDIQPAAQQTHAAAAFSNISGVNFVSAAGCYRGEPAVLAGLTEQAAFAFASRHIYGLKGPGGMGQLKWQLMSLKALRYIQGFATCFNTLMYLVSSILPAKPERSCICAVTVLLHLNSLRIGCGDVFLKQAIFWKGRLLSCEYV